MTTKNPLKVYSFIIITGFQFLMIHFCLQQQIHVAASKQLWKFFFVEEFYFSLLLFTNGIAHSCSAMIIRSPNLSLWTAMKAWRVSMGFLFYNHDDVYEMYDHLTYGE